MRREDIDKAAHVRTNTGIKATDHEARILRLNHSASPV